MILFGTIRYYRRKDKEEMAIESAKWDRKNKEAIAAWEKWDAANLAIGTARLQDKVDGLH